MEENIIKMEDEAVLGLKVNPKLWISTGRSRFETSWKSKPITWGKLIQRLSKPTRTQETQAEYMKLSKSKQDQIKDVGGFVGGVLSDGIRKNGHVKTRDLLTFDIDNAPTDLREQLRANPEFAFAWLVYSTHKHRPDAQRVRLIIPVSRTLSPEEYEAVMRMLASEIGMTYFDPTTFQPARLMYWPSVSRDGKYLFDFEDSDKVLNPDTILSKYEDWHDTTQWPVCDGELRPEHIKKDKQADPTKKEGAVGLFCRTYDVPAAINEFLPDIYKPVDGKSDRYTYTKGTTSAGLVIYDDGLFCYSNHSTDPIHGLDVNAFDLVRLHLFGNLDEKAKPDTPVTKMPSWKAMTDLIAKDKGCIKTRDAEKAKELSDDFDEPLTDPDEWMLRLERTKKGDGAEIKPTIKNLKRILKNDPKLRGIAFDQMAHSVVIRDGQQVPWRKDAGAWTNADDAELYVYLSEIYSDSFKRQDVSDALTAVANLRGFHPVREYLSKLPAWDGIQRMETLFIDYLGAQDNIYTREATAHWLEAAVLRATSYHKIKFDYMPTLSGPGGIGKSTLIARLGGEWYTDDMSFDDMRDKTAAEKVQGVWIVELGELKGMRKADLDAIKSFLSREVDRYRPSYGRIPEARRRGCVFIGTTNADDYLRDTTGNRRFWPIPVSGKGIKKPWDITKDEVDQIWAETLQQVKDMSLKQGDLILSSDAQAIADERQMQAMEHDERTGMVQEYLEKRLPDGWDQMQIYDRRAWLDKYDEHLRKGEAVHPREYVTVLEVWAECLHEDPTKRKRTDSEDVKRMLLDLGWDSSGRARRTEPYGMQKYYILKNKQK